MITIPLHISRVVTGGQHYGQNTVTLYAICVNGAVVTPYVPLGEILSLANVVFDSCQAVELDNTVIWDKEDHQFLIRLFQTHKMRLAS